MLWRRNLKFVEYFWNRICPIIIWLWLFRWYLNNILAVKKYAVQNWTKKNISPYSERTQCTKWDIWDLFYIEACMKRAKKCNSVKLYGMKIVEKPERMNWMICLMKLQIAVFFLDKSADCRPLYNTLYVWRGKKESEMNWRNFFIVVDVFLRFRQ